MKRVLSYLPILWLAAACGDPPIEEADYICSADMQPTTYGYVLDGDQLTLFVPGKEGSEQPPFTREGTGDDLFDSWVASDSSENDLTGRVVVTFTMSQATITATCQRGSDDPVEAEVTGRIIVTDSTIQFLDEKHAWEKF